MRIDNLPKEILLRAMFLKTVSLDKVEHLSQLFFWGDAPEGGGFWSAIDNGNFKIFYAMYPTKKKYFKSRYLNLLNQNEKTV